MLRRAGVAVLCMLLFSSIAGAQEHRFDASLSGVAAFSKTSEGNGVTLKPTTAGGALGSVRLWIAPKVALEGNWGRFKNSQKYNSPPFEYRVQGAVTEFSGDVVYSFMQRGKFHPFVLGGGGVLVFSPEQTFIFTTPFLFGAKRQVEPAILYGLGVDYHAYKAISVRLQYRGLFYRAPYYNFSTLTTSASGHLAEPAVGVVFSF